MADSQRLELDDILNRRAPTSIRQTEVLIVVDDSPEMDAEIFNMEESRGPTGSASPMRYRSTRTRATALLERFQVHLPRRAGIRRGPGRHRRRARRGRQEVGRE